MLFHPTKTRIQYFYSRVEEEINKRPPTEAKSFLSKQITIWEQREEILFLWAKGFGGQGKHPFGGELDAFDMERILSDLRLRRVELGGSYA